MWSETTRHLQGSYLVSIDTHFHMRVAVKQCHKMFFCFPRNLDWCNKFHSSITTYTTTKVIRPMDIPHHHLCPHKSSACRSSSMAWLIHVCNLYITCQICCNVMTYNIQHVRSAAHSIIITCRSAELLSTFKRLLKTELFDESHYSECEHSA